MFKRRLSRRKQACPFPNSCFTPVGALRAIAVLHFTFYSVVSGFAVSYSLDRLAFIPFLVTVACAYLLRDSFQETPKHTRIVVAMFFGEFVVLSVCAAVFCGAVFGVRYSDCPKNGSYREWYCYPGVHQLNIAFYAVCMMIVYFLVRALVVYYLCIEIAGYVYLLQCCLN
ncbi:hypothetical protein DSO57_1003850 [Entomophthora muscae]|uniref:Uncharacterized protein n=1 Tax=Entomophthora muscae TaxID=34485 RepID=A0ACC2UT87_9FUNG|nr:hypothetical protein DSO57_1003850 [Entomophthora muscae]